MKKIYLFLAAVLFGQAAVAQITDPAPYCVCDYRHDYNMFGSITVNGTVHNTGAVGNVATTVGYRFFNTQVFPDLAIGADNTISIVSYSVPDAEPRYFAVYIDINHNNTFEANEAFLQNNNTVNASLNVGAGGAALTITKTFTIPANAMTGQTRMRIVRGQHTAPNFTYGNYDPTYTLASCKVPPPPPFPGGPVNDNSYGVCYDYNVNLTSALSVNDLDQKKNSFQIYPNPVKDYLKISNPNKEEIKKVSIYSSLGQKVHEETVNSKDVISIEVAGLESGVYFAKIETSAAEYSNKFIKE